MITQLMKVQTRFVRNVKKHFRLAIAQITLCLSSPASVSVSRGSNLLSELLISISNDLDGNLDGRSVGHPWCWRCFWRWREPEIFPPEPWLAWLERTFTGKRNWRGRAPLFYCLRIVWKIRSTLPWWISDLTQMAILSKMVKTTHDWLNPWVNNQHQHQHI